jgi:tetratricopeptide (TPR) repeat protein
MIAVTFRGALAGVFASAVSIAAAGGLQPSPREIPKVPADILSRPVSIAKGIGHAHDAVGTASRPAQALYDQGLAYLHSYVWIEAARAFNQALRDDASLAVAHAQLSLALTELNAPAEAHAALDRALALEAKANDHDRRHIEARRLQMAAEDHPSDAALAAYRTALDEALKAFPNDAEFWLLRGNAESPDPADRGQGSVAGSIRYYEKAHALAPEDDAPLHFLTHAYENSRDAANALKTSEQYAKAAPSIPHAQHMHGHVLLGRGRLGEAATAFEAADRIDRAYLAAEKIPAEYEWHVEHNLDLLGASYAYLGQMQKAEQALKDGFALPTALAVQAFNKRNYPAFLTARGRFDDARAAAAALVAHPSSFARVAGQMEDARALMAKTPGDIRPAAPAINAALTVMRSSPPAGAFAAGPFAVLQGEYFIFANQRTRGEPMLRQAVQKLRLLTGPDAHMDALFTLEDIARSMRDAGAWDLAAWAAGQMLEYDANYAGSHFASALALEKTGNPSGARTAFAAAARLWSGADPALPELQLARQKSR